jgi:hypothetical protein
MRVATFLWILKILNKWKWKLLNIHGVDGVWQTEMHTVEPAVPEPSTSEAEDTTAKMEKL